jgi:cell division inhibitor SepF
MAGVWKKTLTYLGLVEDEDDYEDLDDIGAEPVRETTSVRRLARPSAASDMGGSTVRTIPSPRAQAGAATSIHKSEPKRFNDAREVGDKFRSGIPVIMNLQGTDDAVARRLVDFASGLVYGLEGKIENVANRVYLLTPASVEVSAEERERLREGGFYNQF